MWKKEGGYYIDIMLKHNILRMLRHKYKIN